VVLNWLANRRESIGLELSFVPINRSKVKSGETARLAENFFQVISDDFSAWLVRNPALLPSIIG